MARIKLASDIYCFADMAIVKTTQNACVGKYVKVKKKKNVCIYKIKKDKPLLFPSYDRNLSRFLIHSKLAAHDITHVCKEWPI